MPRSSWTAKDERMYEHIRDSCVRRRHSLKACKRIAAATVNKLRKRQGRTLGDPIDITEKLFEHDPRLVKAITSRTLSGFAGTPEHHRKITFTLVEDVRRLVDLLGKVDNCKDASMLLLRTGRYINAASVHSKESGGFRHAAIEDLNEDFIHYYKQFMMKCVR